MSKKSEEVRFFNFPETEKRIGKSKLKLVELQTKVREDFTFTIMEKASTTFKTPNRPSLMTFGLTSQFHIYLPCVKGASLG